MKKSSPHIWVTSTYFAEGYPYTVVNNLPEVIFKSFGASLQVVGLTALFHLPWNLKFLWGPFLDQFETKRRWLLGIEIALTIAMIIVALLANRETPLWLLGVAFTVMAFMSATHDIAIDGYYLEALDDEGQSKFVGYRAMAFRGASMLVAGPGLIAAGYIGWTLALLLMTSLMLVITILHFFLVPRVEKRMLPIGELVSRVLGMRLLFAGALVAALIFAERRYNVLRPAWAAIKEHTAIGAGGWIAIGLLVGLLILLGLKNKLRGTKSDYARAFSSFLEQPKVGRILAFVVLFRTGESFLMKMKWPFLDDVILLPLEHYGFANGTVGLACSITGTMLGGWLISRDGLRRWIWPLIIAQNLLNLLYVGLAYHWFGSAPGLTTLTIVIALERLGEGLGTAVFMVYLMRCCAPDHKAAHMAIVSALMSLSYTFAGVISGFMAEALGFGNYFLFTFFATFPMMILIFFIPHIDGRDDVLSSAAS